MRRVVYVCMCIVFVAHAEITTKQIDEIIKKIRLKRPGVDMYTLKNTKDPFIKTPTDTNNTKSAISKKVEHKSFALHAIFNARAFINDRWYKLGDTILGFTLKGIGKESVILQSGNQTKTLLLHPKNNSLIKFEAEGMNEKE